MPIPHSKPWRTDFTSSLKRRSEWIVPSWTMVPSRTMRILSSRRDLAFLHVAAGDDAGLGNAEQLADLDARGVFLVELGSEHADAGGVDVLDRLVDDAVQANVDSSPARRAPWPWAADAR